MCSGCVREGSIAWWLADIIEEYLERWPNDDGSSGHIVLGDFNVEDHHIEFCLQETDPDREGDGPWRSLLRWMLTIPEVERVPAIGWERMEPDA